MTDLPFVIHRYDAGDRFMTVDVEGVRCTLFVCYDLRFAGEMWATAKDTDCYLLLIAEVDPAVVADARHRFPVLRDRR